MANARSKPNAAGNLPATYRLTAVAAWLRPLPLLWLLLLPLVSRGVATNDPCLACDREMRKTIEAMQAWRRLHNGAYPSRIADLKLAGLMPLDGAVCPKVLAEGAGATTGHDETSSRGVDRDPPGTYEYDMSDVVPKSVDDEMYLPAGTHPYSRRDLKIELLRREFSEQVPILRCGSHAAESGGAYGRDDVFRNATTTGNIYWSGLYWEQLFLDDVPYCARDANVLFGLKGPPFYVDAAPSLPEAVDLRPWSCAFGDVAWWWTYPMFEEGVNRQTAPSLRPFFGEKHGRVMELGGTKWWLNGLVQLQGRVIDPGKSPYSGPGMIAFVWQKTGLKINRAIGGASWLEGTTWTARPGSTAGWLVWHFADSSTELVPLVYGRDTARFWADDDQSKDEKNFPAPVWKHHETQAEAGRDRWLRLYRQDWTNPRPNEPVVSLDFVSNSNCQASPFLVSLNVRS